MEPTELDLAWPTRFRNDELNYAQFYEQAVGSLSLFCLYADAGNEIVSVHKARIQLTSAGTLSAGTLRQAAAQCSTLGCDRYRLASGGVFHVGVAPSDMIRFVATDYEPKVWTPLDLKSPGDIRFPDTVPTLADLASVILLFRPRESRGGKTARRPMGTQHSSRVTRRVLPRKGLKADRRHDTT